MSCISLLTLTSVGAATNTDCYHDFGSRAGEAVQLTEVMGSLPSKGSIRLQHAERTLARISARNMRDTVALFERRTSRRTDHICEFPSARWRLWVKRTSIHVRVTSAFPAIPDIRQSGWDVGFVPRGDMGIRGFLLASSSGKTWQ